MIRRLDLEVVREFTLLIIRTLWGVAAEHYRPAFQGKMSGREMSEMERQRENDESLRGDPM